MTNNQMSQSVEDYLETVYLLADAGPVRVTDISRRMNVKKPSVVNALRSLAEREYIVRKPYGSIELTAAGRRAAKSVFARHTIIKGFLTGVLGISESNAEKDACAMEHVLTQETLRRIEGFSKKDVT